MFALKVVLFLDTRYSYNTLETRFVCLSVCLFCFFLDFSDDYFENTVGLHLNQIAIILVYIK